jgi:(S)-2-hydroxy-acid oxidase
MAAKPAVYSIDDLEEHAARHLPKMVLDYFNGGSMDSITLRANRAEYQKWYINPRVLRNVSNITCSTTVFANGNEIPFPCAVAPAAMQRMAHPDGEEAMARGCGAFGTVMGLSTFATTSLEDVKRAGDAARLESGKSRESECVLQMYLFENRETSRDLVQRAERKWNTFPPCHGNRADMSQELDSRP